MGRVATQPVQQTQMVQQKWWCAMCGTYHYYWARQVVEAQQAPKRNTAPTPDAVIDAALRELQLDADDVLYDLGCGGARVLIRASQQYGCRGVGIEIDESQGQRAIQAVSDAGLTDRIRIYRGDARTADVSSATAAYVYLPPEIVQKVIDRLPATCRIASFAHKFNGSNHQICVGNTGVVFFRIGE